ncbi:hypothetical protein CANCADRAFT_3745 [Tortispora caseinolytica NRRL Y-17796]|uniref:Uncharacterized protein n=1 Tax=Tortispora caseinolytica NRRL Y-17796 TaxID=767744 RepID=A0A1E4TBI1_9ASCO|nr:hypothetical protein CANCADRAFT_3745 [Tortispora caseinolytica NRRL Y-17796]
MSFVTPGAASANDLKNDRDLVSLPDDSISSLDFSTQGDYLAVGSWDNKVRLYEVNQNLESQGKALYEHQGPVLSVHWSPDGTKVASGGVDRAGRVFDVATGQAAQMAAHDAPIKDVRFVNVPNAQGPILATASWDKTLKYWDLRQQSPIATVNLPERAYSMDTRSNLLVVATAERHIAIIDLNNPGAIFKSIISPLKLQTRVVSCFPSANGYAVGSIEGRCSIQYVDEKQQKDSFSFKCHRDQVSQGARPEFNVFALNSISFHPQYGTFATCGADGTFHYWDKESRHRLKFFPNLGAPVVASAFNSKGTIFAYAISYDWSKGYQFNRQDYPKTVRLHMVKDEDIKPRPRKR